MFKDPVILDALCNSCVKPPTVSHELIFSFLYAGSNIQNASKQQLVLCIDFSFVNFNLPQTQQTKI
jgi:hypothetical protein